MKTKTLAGLVLLFLCVCGFASCLNENEQEETKVTNHQEYTLTVASKTLRGAVSLGGSNVPADVLAVKKENSQIWEPFYGLQNFTYESGYEYRIRISETSYLNYSMGEPAWTEYTFLQLLSKEKKESEGLPENFIPDWFYEQNK